jgi:hypothetical protein
MLRTTSESANRSRASDCFALAEKASEHARLARLVLVRCGRLGSITEMLAAAKGLRRPTSPESRLPWNSIRLSVAQLAGQILRASRTPVSGAAVGALAHARRLLRTSSEHRTTNSGDARCDRQRGGRRMPIVLSKQQSFDRRMKPLVLAEASRAPAPAAGVRPRERRFLTPAEAAREPSRQRPRSRRHDQRPACARADRSSVP